MPRTRIAPLVALVAVASGMAGAAWWIGQGAPAAPPAPRLTAADPDAGTALDEDDDEDADEAPLDDPGPADLPDEPAGSRPPLPDTYACQLPALEIPRDPRCDEGAAYPACRWQLPDTDAAGGLYVVWRSTTPDHRWARPGLVTLVLAAAREYQSRWPGEHLTVGDLDAAGPRHQTHDRGVDVDLYLEHAMLDVNEGPHRYVDNYASRSRDEVASLRARVTDLARILATCSRGRLRIYYNDPEVLRPFVAWFAEQGLVSDVGPAMTMHNRLHRFHFHMTVPEDLPPIGPG